MTAERDRCGTRLAARRARMLAIDRRFRGDNRVDERA
jgi:hypothetical protein